MQFLNDAPLQIGWSCDAGARCCQHAEFAQIAARGSTQPTRRVCRAVGVVTVGQCCASCARNELRLRFNLRESREDGSVLRAQLCCGQIVVHLREHFLFGTAAAGVHGFGFQSSASGVGVQRLAVSVRDSTEFVMVRHVSSFSSGVRAVLHTQREIPCWLHAGLIGFADTQRLQRR